MKAHWNQTSSVLRILFLAAASMFHSSGVAAAETPQDRLEKAVAMFRERCQTAGEKIYRTIDNVDGIFLLKLRPDAINYGDQFRMDDPYGRDLGGDGYIKNFLLGRNARGSITNTNTVRNGYLFVEAIDPTDGIRYRYTGAMKDVTYTSSILMGGDGKTNFISKAFLLERSVSS